MSISSRLQGRACTVALWAALSTTPALAAPTLTLSGPSGVVPGSTFQIDVNASGFSDLYAYQFDIHFDPTLFKATGVAGGSFLAGAGTTFFDAGSIDNAGGSITFVFETLIGPGAGATGDGDLAHLSFQTIGAPPNTGSFTIDNLIALDSALNPIEVSLQGLAVSIPEPSVLALAMAAFGAALLRRPRNARGTAAPALASA